jgi:glycosyltransferase involved in cell wall biosynthesis
VPIKILVVIPAYNEEATIYEVVSSLISSGYPNVLVVDDGSVDQTTVLAKAAGAQVIRLAYQMGAWRAGQTGMRYARQEHFDEVITFDADGQHLPESIAVLQAAREEADLVIGACVNRGSKLRRLAWRYFRLISGLSLVDFTSGLRLYGRRAIQLLARAEATSLEYQDIGVLMLLSSAGLAFKEVDVDMIERRAGVSRIFYSWRTVAYYMVYTTFLCLAKIGYTPFARITADPSASERLI